MHAGLDPILALSVTLKGSRNSIEHFIGLVHGQEAMARNYFRREKENRARAKKESREPQHYIPRAAARALDMQQQTHRYALPRFSDYGYNPSYNGSQSKQYWPYQSAQPPYAGQSSWESEPEIPPQLIAVCEKDRPRSNR